MKKAQVTNIKFTRGEGLTELCGITYEFDSFSAVNAHIMANEGTYPECGSDKHDFEITFDNGFTYSGTMCLKSDRNPRYDWKMQRMQMHIKFTMEYYIKIGMNAEECQEILDTLELS